MKDDPVVSDLELILQDDDKVGVVWAGCYYGPSDNLEKVVESATLERLRYHLNALRADPNLGTRVEAYNPDDGLGIRWLPV